MLFICACTNIQCRALFTSSDSRLTPTSKYIRTNQVHLHFQSAACHSQHFLFFLYRSPHLFLSLSFSSLYLSSSMYISIPFRHIASFCNSLYVVDFDSFFPFPTTPPNVQRIRKPRSFYTSAVYYSVRLPFIALHSEVLSLSLSLFCVLT